MMDEFDKIVNSKRVPLSQTDIDKCIDFLYHDAMDSLSLDSLQSIFTTSLTVSSSNSRRVDKIVNSDSDYATPTKIISPKTNAYHSEATSSIQKPVCAASPATSCSSVSMDSFVTNLAADSDVQPDSRKISYNTRSRNKAAAVPAMSSNHTNTDSTVDPERANRGENRRFKPNQNKSQKLIAKQNRNIKAKQTATEPIIIESNDNTAPVVTVADSSSSDVFVSRSIFASDTPTAANKSKRKAQRELRKNTPINFQTMFSESDISEMENGKSVDENNNNNQKRKTKKKNSKSRKIVAIEPAHHHHPRSGLTVRKSVSLNVKNLSSVQSKYRRSNAFPSYDDDGWKATATSTVAAFRSEKRAAATPIIARSASIYLPPTFSVKDKEMSKKDDSLDDDDASGVTPETMSFANRRNMWERRSIDPNSRSRNSSFFL